MREEEAKALVKTLTYEEKLMLYERFFELYNQLDSGDQKEVLLKINMADRTGHRVCTPVPLPLPT